MSSRSVYRTPFFSWTSLKSSKRLTSTCVHSFARQLLVLKQWKGENERRKYFLINLQEMLQDPEGIEPEIFWSPVRRAPHWATEAGYVSLDRRCLHNTIRHQGPVVQSIVSLTSSLVVKMLSVLVSTISNLQVFFAKISIFFFSFQQKY